MEVSGLVARGLEGQLCRRTERAVFSPRHKEKARSKAADRGRGTGGDSVSLRKSPSLVPRHTVNQREEASWEICHAPAVLPLPPLLEIYNKKGKALIN